MYSWLRRSWRRGLPGTAPLAGAHGCPRLPPARRPFAAAHLHEPVLSAPKAMRADHTTTTLSKAHEAFVGAAHPLHYCFDRWYGGAISWSLCIWARTDAGRDLSDRRRTTPGHIWDPNWRIWAQPCLSVLYWHVKQPGADRLVRSWVRGRCRPGSVACLQLNRRFLGRGRQAWRADSPPTRKSSATTRDGWDLIAPRRCQSTMWSKCAGLRARPARRESCRPACHPAGFLAHTAAH